MPGRESAPQPMAARSNPISDDDDGDESEESFHVGYLLGLVDNRFGLLIWLLSYSTLLRVTCQVV